MLKFSKHIILLLWLSSICFLFAQDANTSSHNLTIVFPEIALIDIESTEGVDISFEIDNPDVEAGESFQIHEQNDDLWLNYTSLVSQSGASRSISVHTNSNLEVPGLAISLIASAHSGAGDGDLGIPTETVMPSQTPSYILTGIGTAFTGDGTSNGHKLTYKLDYEGNMTDLESMSGEVATVIVIYTITD